MTVKIKTTTGCSINFYEVERIIEKEDTIFLQNAVSPFIIGIDGFAGTPMSTYGIDIYRYYVKEIKVGK